MSTLQGIGTTFYGKKYFNPADKSYITVKWFVFLLLPIMPLNAYRVIKGETKSRFIGILSSSTNYQILGEVPLKRNLDLILFTYLRAYSILISSFLGLLENPIWFLVPIIFIVKFIVDEIKTSSPAPKRPTPEKFIEFNAAEKALPRRRLRSIG